MPAPLSSVAPDDIIERAVGFCRLLTVDLLCKISVGTIPFQWYYVTLIMISKSFRSPLRCQICPTHSSTVSSSIKTTLKSRLFHKGPCWRISGLPSFTAGLVNVLFGFKKKDRACCAFKTCDDITSGNEQTNHSRLQLLNDCFRSRKLEARAQRRCYLNKSSFH